MSCANSKNLYLCSALLGIFSTVIALSVVLDIIPLVIAFAGIELCLLVATGVQIGKRISLRH
ncbi:hypothetical protein [Bifidobacterium indicum]|uniref:hypothetical protein n=1 Tax=Bifidobacterium indicum TaxID=1691 RepID=UPI0030DD1C26